MALLHIHFVDIGFLLEQVLLSLKEVLQMIQLLSLCILLTFLRLLGLVSDREGIF